MTSSYFPVPGPFTRRFSSVTPFMKSFLILLLPQIGHFFFFVEEFLIIVKTRDERRETGNRTTIDSSFSNFPKKKKIVGMQNGHENSGRSMHE